MSHYSHNKYLTLSQFSFVPCSHTDHASDSLPPPPIFSASSSFCRSLLDQDCHKFFPKMYGTPFPRRLHCMDIYSHNATLDLVFFGTFISPSGWVAWGHKPYFSRDDWNTGPHSLSRPKLRPTSPLTVHFETQLNPWTIGFNWINPIKPNNLMDFIGFIQLNQVT